VVGTMIAAIGGNGQEVKGIISNGLHISKVLATPWSRRLYLLSIRPVVVLVPHVLRQFQIQSNQDLDDTN
jgi:hypothetical protein